MRTNRVRVTFLLFGLALAVGGAACGSSTGKTRVEADGSYPAGATDVVLRIDSCCGFTPLEYQLGLVPTVTIYGDGRTIVTGPVTEQYPPHALPNLLTGHVDDAAITELLDQARADGLFETLDFGEPPISDAPTTTVTINDGTERTHRVYALDIGTGAGNNPAVNETQRRARRHIQDFVRAAEKSATRAATEPYTASAVAIYVRRANPVSADDPVEPGRASWPLGRLATIGETVDQGPGADSVYRCAVLTGADATTALAAAATATTITRWESADEEYSIVWRPLLPDEHACPGLGTGPRL